MIHALPARIGIRPPGWMVGDHRPPAGPIRSGRLDLLAVPNDAVDPVGVGDVSAAATPDAVGPAIAGDSDPVVAGAGIDEVLAVAGGEVVVTWPSVTAECRGQSAEKLGTTTTAIVNS
jgi:hypothetical protein